jgi:hypothetical protein
MYVTPVFNEAVLRRPEELKKIIQRILNDESCREFADVANLAKMCLESSATNDYLEKVAVESIGATHLTSKLGPDGELDKMGVEAKPCKKSPGDKNVGVINDDTPMKLVATSDKYHWLVILNATKEGDRVNWALVAPYSYWEGPRFKEIVKKLKLSEDTTWKWGDKLPTDVDEKKKCFAELVTKHKQGQYVRSSSLSLDILPSIPKDQVRFWKHPDLPVNKLNRHLWEFCEAASGNNEKVAKKRVFKVVAS